MFDGPAKKSGGQSLTYLALSLSSAEAPFYASSAHHFSAFAHGTAELFAFELDEENQMSFFIAGSKVAMGTRAESLIQEAFGHEGLLSFGCIGEHPMGKSDCPLFSPPKYSQSG
jgi:hypothetical protein